jgi:hypothetical protein
VARREASSAWLSRALVAGGVPMSGEVIAGTTVPPSRTYCCMTCDYCLIADGTAPMPPCPQCGNGQWEPAPEATPPSYEEVGD